MSPISVSLWDQLAKSNRSQVIDVGIGYPGDLSLSIFRMEEMLVTSKGLGTSFRKRVLGRTVKSCKRRVKTSRISF